MDKVLTTEEVLLMSGMDVPVFNIRKEMKDTKNFAMAVYGKRRMGKSVMIRDLISQIKDWYDEIFVFSETIDLQPDLFDYVPKKNRFNSFNQEKMREIWANQEYIIKTKMKQNVPKEKCPHILMIFDDVICDKHIRNSEIFNNLHVKGRHNCIASIVLSQEFGGKDGISKVCRANVDIAAFFYPNNAYDRELMVTQYLSTQGVKQGMALLKKICSIQYQTTVVLNFKTELGYKDYVRKYIANPNVPVFKVGTKPEYAAIGPAEYLKMNEIFNPKYESDIILKFAKPKAKRTIKIIH
jgi:hypothetical protein